MDTPWPERLAVIVNFAERNVTAMECAEVTFEKV